MAENRDRVDRGPRSASLLTELRPWPNRASPRYPLTFATALLERSGVRADIARDVADVLVTGDLLGHDARSRAAPPYLEEIEAGRWRRASRRS
jgi:hypothetical protein